MIVININARLINTAMIIPVTQMEKKINKMYSDSHGESKFERYKKFWFMRLFVSFFSFMNSML